MPQELQVYGGGAHSSIRWQATHWILRYHTGYLMHPNIPLDKSDIKIADVGCKTGLWLIELARSLSPSARLDGFDVSSRYPPDELLPENVRFHNVDLGVSVPEDLVGQYDVVHIGLQVNTITDGDPVPLLVNMVSMLKPGGYLQWDEFDPASSRPVAPRPDVEYPGCQLFGKRIHEWLYSKGIRYEWISQLDAIFGHNDIKPLSMDRLHIRNEVARAWTDNHLLLIQEVLENAVIPSCLQEEGDGSSTQEWRDLYKQIVVECEQGVNIPVDIVIVVGRKAS